MITRIREATPQDRRTIWRMILREWLDPTAVHWSQFLVAQQDERVIGIGQIRPYPDGRELGSLVVCSDMQGQGVGAALVDALLQAVPEDAPVYLECPDSMTSYYAQFGFAVIPPADAPPSLRRKTRFTAPLARLFGLRVRVMRRPPSREVAPLPDFDAPHVKSHDDI